MTNQWQFYLLHSIIILNLLNFSKQSLLYSSDIPQTLMGEYVCCENGKCSPLSDQVSIKRNKDYVIIFDKPFDSLPQIGIFYSKYQDGSNEHPRNACAVQPSLIQKDQFTFRCFTMFHNFLLNLKIQWIATTNPKIQIVNNIQVKADTTNHYYKGYGFETESYLIEIPRFQWVNVTLPISTQSSNPAQLVGLCGQHHNHMEQMNAMILIGIAENQLQFTLFTCYDFSSDCILLEQNVIEENFFLMIDFQDIKIKQDPPKQSVYQVNIPIQQPIENQFIFKLTSVLNNFGDHKINYSIEDTEQWENGNQRIFNINLFQLYPNNPYIRVFFGVITKYYCQDGEFLDQNDLTQCFPCDQVCQTCTLSSSNCNQCANNSYRDISTQCLSCQEGYYMNENNICENCHQSCLSCNGTTSNNCLSCNYLLRVDNSCQDTCEENAYEENGICKLCNSTCKKCQATASTCTDCIETKYLSGNQCLDCINPCYSCIDSQDNCLSCQSQMPKLYLKQSGNNTQTCDTCTAEGLILYDNYCYSCPKNCLQCSTLKNCIKCQSPYKLYLNQCLQDCPSNYYGQQIENEFYCEQCPQNCITCTEGNICLSCDQNMNLQPQLQNGIIQQQLCVQKCYQGFFLSENQCKSCSSQCQQCSDDQNCQQCEKNSFFLNGFCYQTCPREYYHDEYQMICEPCHKDCFKCIGPNSNQCTECSLDRYFNQVVSNDYGECLKCWKGCASCDDSSDDHCTSCLPGFLFFNNDNISQCLLKCPSGFLPKFDDQICYPCPSNCQFCYGFEEGQCYECLQNKYMILETRLCVEQELCPTNTYPNNELKICQSCHYTCQTCNGANIDDCISCSTEIFKYQQETYCVERCNNDYYLDGNQCKPCSQSCYQCSGETKTDCLSCQSGLKLLNNTCYLTCPDGYFEEQIQCSPCNNQCKTCFGGQDNQCYSCQTGYLYQFSCLSNCPNNHYKENSLKICQRCEDNCSSCQESGCNSCESNYFLQKGQCLQQCSYGYVLNPQTNVCMQCDPSCKTCQLDNLSNCLSCYDRTYLNGVQCVKSIDCPQFSQPLVNLCVYKCKENQYFEIGLNECKNCHIECLQCDGETNNDCLSCRNGQYLFYNQCIEVCPDGFIPDYQQQSCQKCDSKCQKCIGPTENQCQECLIQFYNLNNQCYESCSQGYYQSEQKCLQCSSYCLNCIDENKCIACEQNIFLEESQCVFQCSNGYMANNKRVCKSCPEKCDPITCFGNQLDGCIDPCQNCLICAAVCQECDTSYFLLDFRCLLTCPEGFYQETADKTCIKCDLNCETCDSTQCLTCSIGKYLMDQRCQVECDQQYYPDYRKVCQSCDESCLNCNGPTKYQCTLCQAENYLLNGLCVQDCPSNYYVDNNSSCQICNLNCRECNGQLYTNCTKCYPGEFLYDGQCFIQCPQSTYKYDKVCLDCFSKECSSCFNSDENSCQYCITGLVLQDNLCTQTCNDGFYENDGICKNCPYQCITCKDTENCIECAGNRVNPPICECPEFTQIDSKEAYCQKSYYTCQYSSLVPINCTSCRINRRKTPLCLCNDGYYDEENEECQKCSHKCQICAINQDRCLHCLGNRLLDQNCNCPKGFYDDNESYNCLKCSQTCSFCTQNEKNCTECLGNRVEVPSCLCPSNYYEDNLSYNCPHCPVLCNNCIDQSLCIDCNQDRINPPFCKCPDGFYEIYQVQCKVCPAVCKTCNEEGCFSCIENRILEERVCLCPNLGADRQHLGTFKCSTCQLAVLESFFTDDLNHILIEVGFQIEMVDQSSICDEILQQDSFKKLGQNPKCTITDDFNQLKISLGQSSQILITDEIQIISNSLKGKYCQNSFIDSTESKFNLEILKENKLPTPIFSFQQIKNEYSLCEEIQLIIQSERFNGMRKLQYLEWQLLDHNDTNSKTIKRINQLIIEENEIIKNKNDPTLIIPKLLLSKYSFYRFQLRAQNFLGGIGITQVKIKTLSSISTSTFVDKLSQENKFYRHQSHSFQGNIIQGDCSKPNEEQQFKKVSYQWFLINNETQSQVQNSTLQYLNDFEQKPQDFVIEPYTLNVNQTYIYQLQMQIIELPKIYNDEWYITITESQLQMQFIGGDRYLGFQNQLKLEISIQDLDIDKNQQPSLYSYNYEWNCKNLNTNGECFDIKNQLVQLNQTYYQEFRNKSLVPYDTLKFKVYAKRGKREAVTSVTITITEIDLPELKIIIPQIIIYKKANLFQKIFFQLIYPKINPDILTFNGALVYNYDLVSTMKFSYFDFSLIIWDHFNEVQQNVTNQISFRASVYNPNFYLPSITNVQITVNIPPSNCQLFLDKTEGIEFQTKFNIQINRCLDNDLPLLYQLFIYPSIKDYDQDIVNSQQLKGIPLFGKTSIHEFTLVLPYMDYPQSILLAQIEDNNYGITNLTQIVQIKQNIDLQPNDILLYLNQFQTFPNRIFGLCIVSYRLKNITKILFQEIIQNTYQELLDLSNDESLEQKQNQLVQQSIEILFTNQLLRKETINLNHLNENLDYNQQRISDLQEVLVKLYQQYSDGLDDSLTTQQLIDVYQEQDRIVGILDQLLFINRDYLEIPNSSPEILNITDDQNRIKDIQIIYPILEETSENRKVSLFNVKLIKLFEKILENQAIGLIVNEPPRYNNKEQVSLTTSMMSAGKLMEIMPEILVEQTSIEIQLDDEKDQLQQSEAMNESQFFKIYRQIYNTNPYYTEDSFPKNSSQSSVIDLKIINNQSGLNVKPSNPIKFKQQGIINNETIQGQCIGKQNQTWIKDCETTNQNETTVCECENLTPKSIIETSLIITKEKLLQLYSKDNFDDIQSFHFEKTILFYILLTILTGLLTIFIWGYQTDRKQQQRKTKIMPTPKDGFSFSYVPSKIHTQNQELNKEQKQEKIEKSFDEPQQSFNQQENSGQKHQRYDQVTIQKSDVCIENMDQKDEVEEKFDQNEQKNQQKISSNIIIRPQRKQLSIIEKPKFETQTSLTPDEHQRRKSEKQNKEAEILKMNESLSIQQEIYQIVFKKYQMQSVGQMRIIFEFIKLKHSLLGIIFFYNKDLSRPVRTFLYALTILLELVTTLFFKNDLQLITILQIIIIASTTKFIFLLVGEKLLCSKRTILAIIGVLYSISILIFTMLTLILLMVSNGSIESVNIQTIQFAISFTLDNVIFENLAICFIALLAKKVHQKSNLKVIKFQFLGKIIIGNTENLLDKSNL